MDNVMSGIELRKMLRMSLSFDIRYIYPDNIASTIQIHNYIITPNAIINNNTITHFDYIYDEIYNIELRPEKRFVILSCNDIYRTIYNSECIHIISGYYDGSIIRRSNIICGFVTNKDIVRILPVDIIYKGNDHIIRGEDNKIYTFGSTIYKSIPMASISRIISIDNTKLLVSNIHSTYNQTFIMNLSTRLRCFLPFVIFPFNECLYNVLVNQIKKNYYFILE